MALQFTRVATLDEALSFTIDEMLALGLLPPMAGAEEPAPEPTPAPTEEPQEDPEEEDEEPDDEPEAKPELDWKRLARRHEREAKKRQKDLDALRAKLAEREDADKSEQEKAIEQAKKDAVKELETKHESERRQDRLELASTKAAAKGLSIGTGDDAKTLKFADPDDALVYLERAISRGDVEEEDLFDDRGRVKDEALTEALTDILERKPHLAADGKAAKKVKGGADSGKGTAPNTGSSVEDQFKRIHRGARTATEQVITRRQ